MLWGCGAAKRSRKVNRIDSLLTVFDEVAKEVSHLTSTNFNFLSFEN